VKKNAVFLLMLIFAFGQAVIAQDFSTAGGSSGEKKMAVSMGMEFNMNARENFAGGAVLSFDYNLPFARPFALGLNFTYSNNFSGIAVLEPAAMFRMYFSGNRHEGLFAQADLGTYIVLEEQEDDLMFLGGVRAGIRVPMGNFYVEPYGRLGYPFAFGIGITAGMGF